MQGPPPQQYMEDSHYAQGPHDDNVQGQGGGLVQDLMVVPTAIPPPPSFEQVSEKLKVSAATSMGGSAIDEFLLVLNEKEEFARRSQQTHRASIRHSAARQTRRDSDILLGGVRLSSWMNAFPDASPLHMVIPGVHGASTVNLTVEREPGRHCPWRVCAPCAHGINTVQDHMPWALLHAGCRYFEIKVCHCDELEGDGARYRLCSFFLGVCLTEWLEDMKTFLDDHLTEVVILNVRDLVSFQQVFFSDHDDLVHHIVEVLGGEPRFVRPEERFLDLHDLWERSRQVMLVYSPARTLWEDVKDVVMSVAVTRPFDVYSVMHIQSASECVTQMKQSLERRFAHSEKAPGPYVLKASVRPLPWLCYMCCSRCCGGDRRTSAQRMSQCIKENLLAEPECFWRDGVVIMLDFAEMDTDLLSKLVAKNWMLFDVSGDPELGVLTIDKE